MKKLLCLLLCAAMLLPCSAVFADGIEVSRCVTWLLRPERSNPYIGLVNYYSEYVLPGNIPPIPEIIPEYETEDDFCVFECWVRLQGKEIDAYFDDKTGFIPHNAPRMVQQEPDPIKDRDQVYGAFFRLQKKEFTITDDRTVDILDVTALLDFLSGIPCENPGEGLKRMLESEKLISIKEVTRLLNYLT